MTKTLTLLELVLKGLQNIVAIKSKLLKPLLQNCSIDIYPFFSWGSRCVLSKL